MARTPISLAVISSDRTSVHWIGAGQPTDTASSTSLSALIAQPQGTGFSSCRSTYMPAIALGAASLWQRRCRKRTRCCMRWRRGSKGSVRSPMLVRAVGSNDADPAPEDSSSDEGQTALSQRDNFNQMSLCFALNHGVVTTPLGVATSLLGLEVANTGNGLLYVCTLLSSLFLGAPVTASLGPRGSLLLGMALYCFYIGCFALAVSQPIGETQQWVPFLAGSASGGLAAGLLWTAQGVYFDTTAVEVAAAEGQSKENITASLASSFAFSYLGLEVASKLGFSGLQFAGVDPTVIAALYFVVGVASVLLMAGVQDLRPPNAAQVDPFKKFSAATSLWSNPCIWLLAPCNLVFGFSAAYMNGYVNGTFAVQELGKDSVALLGGITALIAAVLARAAYGPLAQSSGKGAVLLIGAGSFLLIPASVGLSGGCAGWGLGLLALYLLQGSGRAVYESTNRAVFADFFTGEEAEGAFANCMLQSSLAFAACFFLQASASPETLGIIVALLAVLTPVGYGAACKLRDREALSGATDSS